MDEDIGLLDTFIDRLYRKLPLSETELAWKRIMDTIYHKYRFYCKFDDIYDSYQISYFGLIPVFRKSKQGEGKLFYAACANRHRNRIRDDERARKRFRVDIFGYEELDEKYLATEPPTRDVFYWEGVREKLRGAGYSDVDVEEFCENFYG